MADALHGDRVLIKVSKKKRPVRRNSRGRPVRAAPEERLEGIVVRVLERRSPAVVGRFYEHPRFPFVVPLDLRLLHDIRIPYNAAKEAKNGQIVVLTLTVPPGRNQTPEGRITEVLGYPGDPGMEYQHCPAQVRPSGSVQSGSPEGSAFDSRSCFEGRTQWTGRFSHTAHGYNRWRDRARL